MEICNFDRLFSFDSYLPNLSSNFKKMMTIGSYKPGLSACERIISVDCIMNALEHCKVRLLFFVYTLYIYMVMLLTYDAWIKCYPCDYYEVNSVTILHIIVELSIIQWWIDKNELSLRHSALKYYNLHALLGLKRVAQVVEHDANNIKVVSSILIAVKLFLTFPVETHFHMRTFYIHQFKVSFKCPLVGTFLHVNMRKMFNLNTVKVSLLKYTLSILLTKYA